NAWNALLLDMPLERIQLVQKLGKKYRTFLLSNTNDIHIQKVNQILFEASGMKKLDELFETAYYSYKINLGKPDVAIYEYVLKDKNLRPEETVFIDDNKDNIEGAKKAGLHVILVQDKTIIELLKHA
ncbi:MAG: HAD-IA family hydrolase, partial [Cytophagaceae bacterium]|nr:HAD-IA family hydrolase [Cytophagaceae bacterium]